MEVQMGEWGRGQVQIKEQITSDFISVLCSFARPKHFKFKQDGFMF